ncbi:MAG: hypothetical protein JWQ30_1719 [Sediminibacterium sp.]|nr:hypothetical protein [Sediminibacterium sp.]
MLSQPIKTILLLTCLGCITETGIVPGFNPSMHSIKEIPLPAGFERIPVSTNLFADYLRNLPLRKDKTVYLYNKQPKSDQSLHYAVIDISTGDRDLQQCADAVMRLRAEYFYGKKLYDSIRIPKDNHTVYQFSQFLKNNPTNEKEAFRKFMEIVFINCGSYTLEQQLKSVKNITDMQPGDVFVKGGAPGHAEIVVDMAINKQTGKKIYLLAEGYMPAQDIHILLNPLNSGYGPWHELANDKQVITATWIFSANQLRRW